MNTANARSTLRGSSREIMESSLNGNRIEGIYRSGDSDRQDSCALLLKIHSLQKLLPASSTRICPELVREWIRKSK